MLNKLKNFNWGKNMFLVPILLVAGISISHVVSWYNMANPITWAIYLSIAIEVGAITSLMAATKKIKGVWFMFGLVTFIQMIGNIFYSYVQIDENGDLFKDWIELTSPLFEILGTDSSDVIPHKRWLALLEGGLLPLISLTALHFYIKYDDSNTKTLITTPDEPNGLPMNVGQEPIPKLHKIDVEEDYDVVYGLGTPSETHPFKVEYNIVDEHDVEIEEELKEIDEPKLPKEISEDEAERQKHLKFRKRIIENENDIKTVIRPKRDKITQKIIKP